MDVPGSDRLGGNGSTEQYVQLAYAELRSLARAYLRSRGRDYALQTTALVHEAYIRLKNHNGAGWNSRAHFCAVASQAMRQLLSNHLRAERAAKRGGRGGRSRVRLGDVSAPAPRGLAAIDLLALDEALTVLTELDERQGRVVECRVFGGMTTEEIAEVLEVSTSTVDRDWRSARAWLLARLDGETG